MTTPRAEKAFTMLIAFHVTNVRSFRDPLDFSLEATALADSGVARQIPWRGDGNTQSLIDVLPAAVVFGANAAGKTNLLRAMDDMRDLVLQSYKKSGERTLRRLRRPFRLDPECEKAPSTFEVELVLSGVRHRYGFTIDDAHVISEWAYRYTKGRPATVFKRDIKGVTLGETIEKTPKARAVPELVRSDALFLSVAAAAEYPELEPLYDWFSRNLILCDARSREARWAYTAHLMSHDDRRDQVIELLQIADLGITNAKPKHPDPEELEFIRKIAKVLHDESGDESELPDLDLDTVVGILLSHKGRHGSCELESRDESLGTLVWLGLIGPVLDSLASGTVLLVDELESSLHPDLVEQLVRIFQSQETNPNGAQLIFNSHEAMLLGSSDDDRIIGRDQIWFAEKLNDGATHMYSLTDLSPRKSEAIGKRYRQGRYGAKPIISPAEFRALAKLVAAGPEDS